MAQLPNKHCAACGYSHPFLELGSELISAAPGCNKRLAKRDEPQQPKVVEPPRSGPVWPADLRIGNDKKPQ